MKYSLSKAVCDTYALESMIYLTAGLIDGYENADVDMESAIIKVGFTLNFRIYFVKIWVMNVHITLEMMN